MPPTATVASPGRAAGASAVPGYRFRDLARPEDHHHEDHRRDEDWKVVAHQPRQGVVRADRTHFQEGAVLSIGGHADDAFVDVDADDDAHAH